VPCTQFTSPTEASPWVAHPDNVNDFFQTGGTLSSTVAVSGGTDRVSARLSIGRDNVDGYIPNNTFTKTSAMLSGEVQVTDKLKATSSLNYTRNVGVNRPGVGYNVGILEQFIWFGRQVDMNALKRYRAGSESNGGPEGREFSWNYNYHNNPYWLQDENPQRDTRDRFIGSVTATYDLTDWLSATGRAGGDIYTYDIDRDYAAGNINFADPAYSGGFTFINDKSQTNTFDLFLQADRELMPGLTVQGLVGGSQLRTRFNTRRVETEGISAPGIYNVTNAAITPTLDQDLQRRLVNSLLGSAALTWQNWLTVEATGRNDWSSTLPKGANSYFYPSLSASAVLTEAIPGLRGNPVLSLMRVRGSVARVGNDAPIYSLATTFSGLSSQFGGLPQFTLGNTIANAQLKPEVTNAEEVGLELGFFDGRASLDATYYRKSTRDQIFNVAVSSTTGFNSRAINAGQMDNHGVEALLTIVPVRMANSFEWTTSFNYAWNKNKVVDLIGDLKSLDLGTSWYTYVQARVGEPYGSIYGNAFARDEATGKILTDGGLPVLDDEPRVIGNISPKWTGGWSNTFTYRNFSLNALLDMRIGGDIVSITNFFGDYAGVTKGSLRGREVAWNDPGITVDGIDVNTGEPNAETVTAEKYFQGIFPVMEPYVYDGGWVKLREVRFGVDLPQAWAARMSADRVSLALIGRNLWANTHVPNIDPEFAYSIGNYQGVEFAALPNTRSFGFSVNIIP
jgi:TonB-linked SusC/RagA family outer membrane protein